MRLFVLGDAPLPREKDIENQTAYGLRTWQFLSLLSQTKLSFCQLVLLSKGKEKSETIKLHGQKIEVLYLNKNKKGFFRKLKKSFKESKPSTCIGVNNLASYYLAKLSPKIPFWADLNGWIMGEAQSQAFTDQNNAYIHVLWNREKTILETADRISTVSKMQKHATYGELASLGRLNAETENYSFITVIPNANQLSLTKQKASSFKMKVQKNAFKLFFSGSYNTWLDVELLFKGVSQAMGKDPNIYFISTGGGNDIFDKFHKKTQNSKFKDRFVFLGWLKKEDLLACYKQASLAINIDRKNTESYFGARNRINEWIDHKVPVLSTVATEITKELALQDLIIGVDLNKPKDLSQKILSAKKQDLKNMAKKAKIYADKNYAYKETTKALVKWLKNPKKAPDASRKPFRKSFLSKLKFRIKKDGIFFLIKWLWKKTF